METLISLCSPKWFHVNSLTFGSGKPHFFSLTFIVVVYQGLVFVDYMEKQFHSVCLLVVPCKMGGEGGWAPRSPRSPGHPGHPGQEGGEVLAPRSPRSPGHQVHPGQEGRGGVGTNIT